MGLVVLLGRISDELTEQLLRRSDETSSAALIRDRMGFVRKAQLVAIMSLSRPMMLANICNALALLALEQTLRVLTWATIVWAGLVIVVACLGLRQATLFHRAPKRATSSVRAPGKVVIYAFLLALIWCYPLIFVLPNGHLLEVAFVSALAAGMIAGGALALYPVPLAGMIYTLTLSSVAFVALVVGGTLPKLSFGLVTVAFCFVVAYSVRRHTGVFLAEFLGKMEAERQRDMVNLLLDTNQGQGGQYLWRSDPALNLTTEPEPLLQMLGLDTRAGDPTSLVDILRQTGAMPYDNPSLVAYSMLLSRPLEMSTHFDMTLRLQNNQILKLAGRAEVGVGEAPSGYQGYVKDITTEVSATEKVYHLATRDTMTGLLNYSEFKKRAGGLLEDLDVGDDVAVFLFLDADNLKTVNDNFGHAVGDRLIETIANRLERHLPRDSLVARKGGDEFVVLLRGDADLKADPFSAELMAAINRSFRCGEMEIPISCCIGISTSAFADACLQDLELEADRALYHAKSQGKRQVRIYEDAIGAEIHRDRVLANDLPTALESGALALEFQPIVSLASDKIIGAEALVRWTHPLFGAVTPEKIVVIAQAEGQGPALLEYMLRAATDHAARWPSDAFVSVNINSADLQWSNLTGRAEDILQQTKFDPCRLWLEVTESEMLRNSDEVQANLRSLRAKGVKIAVDDFGAGYSSLSYLSLYPSDIIKIDKSLIRHCDTSDSNKIIIKAMRALAMVNGFEVVAEGAETEAEVAALRSSDFEMAQGYAFHRPMKPKRIQALLGQEAADQRLAKSVA